MNHKDEHEEFQGLEPNFHDDVESHDKARIRRLLEDKLEDKRLRRELRDDFDDLDDDFDWDDYK